MGRHRTNWPAALCSRLTVGDVLRGRDRKHPSPRLVRARTGSDTLAPMAVLPTVSKGWLRAAAVSFRATEYPYQICAHRIGVHPTTDSRGRRRFRFVCPDCQRAVDALYLAPEAAALACRRCARVSYHGLPPAPAGRDGLRWARAMAAARGACAELRGQAGAALAPGQRSYTQVNSERSRRQVACEAQDGLTARQRAVAHLWGWCGWSVEQLAQLFAVSDRTIKRDLRAARAAKVLPQRGEGPAMALLPRARSMLSACARLRGAVGAASEDLRPDGPGLFWAAALQARLLAEERKLLGLMATLPGADGRKLGEKGDLPDFLDPELLNVVKEFVQGK